MSSVVTQVSRENYAHRNILNRLNRVFDLMDTNGDGKLSQGEIARALRRQEYAVDQNLVENMIWEVDEDHDGHVGREEFLRAYERCSNDPTASEPRQLYNVVLFFLHASRPPGSNNQDVLRMTGEDASRLVYLHHGREGMEAEMGATFGEKWKEHKCAMNLEEFVKAMTMRDVALGRGRRLIMTATTMYKNRRVVVKK